MLPLQKNRPPRRDRAAGFEKVQSRGRRPGRIDRLDRINRIHRINRINRINRTHRFLVHHSSCRFSGRKKLALPYGPSRIVRCHGKATLPGGSHFGEIFTMHSLMEATRPRRAQACDSPGRVSLRVRQLNR